MITEHPVEEIGTLAGESGKRLTERQVRRRRRTEIDAVSYQREQVAIAGDVGEFGQQTGLADAGVAPEHDDRRAAGSGTVDRVEQVAELAGSPYERRYGTWHGPIFVPHTDNLVRGINRDRHRSAVPARLAGACLAPARQRIDGRAWAQPLTPIGQLGGEGVGAEVMKLEHDCSSVSACVGQCLCRSVLVPASRTLRV